MHMNRRNAVSRATPTRRNASGFSMIEVLIAIVVLALGLLGFALLQTMNLRYTQSANYRTEATNLAYDMLDQMRANRLVAAQYSAATFAAGSQTGANCSRPTGATSVAANALRWQCQVAEALGENASADVTYVDGVATVAINWDERTNESDTTPQFIVTTRI